MLKPKTYIVDFDDLCDEVSNEIDILEQCKKLYYNFKVTLFTIPSKTSPWVVDFIRELNSKYIASGSEWIMLAPHGWHHTRGECLGWTKDEAIDKILAAKEMGINAPCFRAPGWLLDKEIYAACKELNYTVCSHTDLRLPNNVVSEYVYNDVRYRGKNTRSVHGHLTNVCDNYIKDLDDKGTLTFGGSTHPQFGWPFLEGAYVPRLVI